MTESSWTARAMQKYADGDSAAKTDDNGQNQPISSLLAADSPSASFSHTPPRPLVEVRWSSSLRGYLAVTDRSDGSVHEIPYREATAVWQAAVRRGR